LFTPGLLVGVTTIDQFVSDPIPAQARASEEEGLVIDRFPSSLSICHHDLDEIDTFLANRERVVDSILGNVGINVDYHGADESSICLRTSPYSILVMTPTR
jgi:hypothetical protein